MVLLFLETSKTLKSGFNSALVSRTILKGFFPLTKRTVSSGLSIKTVFLPTRIASDIALNLWANLRALSPEIHLESPLDTAILPSRL